MRRPTKLAAATGAALAIAGAGAALAADRLTSSKSESDAILNDAAAQLGIEPAKLTNALEQALKNRVDELVEEGHLTERQGEALKQRIDLDRLPYLAVRPFETRFGGPGFPGGRIFFPGLGPHLDEAAAYLGLSTNELRTALREGNTLADVAKDEGKSVNGLVDRLVAAEKRDLEQAVEDDYLTDAQRDRAVATLEERVTDYVNGTAPPVGLGPRGHFLLPGMVPRRERPNDP